MTQQATPNPVELFEKATSGINKIISTGLGGIGGGIGPSPEGVNRVTFYVDVDDLQAYLDKAERLGGKTVMPPHRNPGHDYTSHVL